MTPYATSSLPTFAILSTNSAQSSTFLPSVIVSSLIPSSLPGPGTPLADMIRQHIIPGAGLVLTGDLLLCAAQPVTGGHSWDPPDLSLPKYDKIL